MSTTSAEPRADAQETAAKTVEKWELPVLPVRGAVPFPHGVVPLTVGRARSVASVEGLDASRRIAVLSQRDPSQDDPAFEELHPIGCLGVVHRVARTQPEGGTLIAFVQGIGRIRALETVQTDPFMKVRVEPLADVMPEEEDAEFVALRRNVGELFQEVVEASPSLSSDVLALLPHLGDAGAVADVVAGTMTWLSNEVRQELLETVDVRARMRRLVEELLREREDLRMRDKIRAEVDKSITDAQRRVMLREQMKAIQKELGEADEVTREVEELKRRLADAGLPEEARKEADRELERLQQIPPSSPEFGVARTYLDLMAALPWSTSTAQQLDLDRARKILDEDHFDLEKVKERILEHIAVIGLKRSLKGPILCFVGPPGVGKTSIGRSIARAMGRRFVRLSLGGIRDEAEIRGHRRTYIGALPGQIIESIRRVGANDPVFMLDEVDKLGRDFRGDPAAALLEVLDPEQNDSFRDHYLDVAFDLSRVLFITTANVLVSMPPALRDRMEVLELPGYAEGEKLQIARRYLVPNQMEAHGLEAGTHLNFTDVGLREVIRNDTREAGVRELDRKIAAICRKRAKQVLEGDTECLSVTAATVRKLLGAPRHRGEKLDERTRVPGVAVALAWTPVGGEILFVEAASIPGGQGKFTITGQVQPVMEESMRAALTWLKANCDRLRVSCQDVMSHDIHIHVPAGAVPKDGPSAGVVMVTALVSLFRKRPVRKDIALSGEITLTGRVLPVGGVKEKVLAARQHGIHHVVLPSENRADAEEELTPAQREGIQIHFVDTVEEVLALAFDEEEGPDASEEQACAR